MKLTWRTSSCVCASLSVLHTQRLNLEMRYPHPSIYFTSYHLHTSPTHPRIYSCLQTQAEIVIEELIEHGRCSIERVIARATDWVIQMRGASCTGNSSEGEERVRG